MPLHCEDSGRAAADHRDVLDRRPRAGGNRDHSARPVTRRLSMAKKRNGEPETSDDAEHSAEPQKCGACHGPLPKVTAHNLAAFARLGCEVSRLRCSPQGLTAARAAARGDPRRRPAAKPRPRGHRDLEKPDRHHSGAQQALSERGAFARRAGHGAARLQHQPGRASAVEPHRDQLRIGRARCGGACSSGACTTFSATAAGACRQGVDGPAALQHPLRCRDSGTTRDMVRFHRST